MSWAIETDNLSKQFPKQTRGLGLLFSPKLSNPAVDRVNIQVAKGELFGLLGPNGAGKTTLIKMLSTLILPTSGTAWINGIEITHETEVKSNIGVVTSDERSFFWRLTGRQNLEFFAALNGMTKNISQSRIAELTELLDIGSIIDDRFLTYSTGNRQRFAIARALLNQPKILFLDEPSRGLDPIATDKLHHLVQDRLNQIQGITIFLTTHDLQEAQSLCHRIAFMNHGSIRACGTIDDLQSELNLEEHFTIRVDALTKETESAIKNQFPSVEIRQEPENLLSTSEGETAQLTVPAKHSRQLNQIVSLLISQRSSLLSVEKQSPSLETIFSHLVQETNAPLTPATQANQPPTQTRNIDAASTFHPLGKSSLRIAGAFIKRDFIAEISYKVSFLLQFLNIFFSVGVFFFLSRLIDKSAVIPSLASYGGNYFSFVLIGIAFAGYFGVGLSSFASNLREAQTTGVIEAMLSTPVSIPMIILASSQWDYLFTTLKVFVYLILGVGFLNVQLGKVNYPAALVILLLTIITFSSLGIIAASFIMVLKRGDPITWMFNALSTLLGGVYYPISILPGWMQTIARLVPITYALEAMRKALLSSASFAELLPEILALTLFSVILLPLSLAIFKYAVRRAKMDGSLTHY